jgi:hypothetical protein
VASGLADPFVFVGIPGLLLLPAGMASMGALAAAALAAVAGLELVAALLALSSGLAFTVHLVLRDRRRAEALGLVGIIALGALGVVPALLGERIERRPAGERVGAGTAPPGDHDRAASTAGCWRRPRGPRGAGAAAGGPSPSAACRSSGRAPRRSRWRRSARSAAPSAAGCRCSSPRCSWW